MFALKGSAHEGSALAGSVCEEGAVFICVEACVRGTFPGKTEKKSMDKNEQQIQQKDCLCKFPPARQRNVY